MRFIPGINVATDDYMRNPNNATEPQITRPTLDALSLEYQRDYGTARGDLNIADLMNNPAANGVCRVFDGGLDPRGLIVKTLVKN